MATHLKHTSCTYVYIKVNLIKVKGSFNCHLTTQGCSTKCKIRQGKDEENDVKIK